MKAINWIPEKQHRPDKVGRYLATWSWGAINIAYYSGVCFCPVASPFTRDVCVAWAELPKPYTAEDPGEWIPLSKDRPTEAPGKSIVYLCTWADGDVFEGHYIDGHFRLYGENVDRKIVAWMEMPEPYREAHNA